MQHWTLQNIHHKAEAQISLIRKFYSYIVVNKLWLALEWYIYTHAMVST